MFKKFIPLFSIFLLLAALLSPWLFPSVTFVIGLASLLLSLAFSTYTVIQKHRGTEHARAKILKEAGLLVLTLILVIFLGGLASMLANYQVGIRWGEIAGLVSALAASFMVGYLVKKGVTKFVG